jgi:hypothetical protein
VSDLGRWTPLDPVEVRRLLAPLEAPWWIAGGWALDMFLRRKTRDHADVDVELPRQDELVIQEHLRSWELFGASDGVLTPWAAGERLPAGTSDVWCRPAGTDSWALQLMFNPGDRTTWVSKRHAGITRPLETAVRHTGDGIPYLAPELQLLMKAKGRRPKDETDFDVVVPALDDEQRAWLRTAIERAHPGSPWLARL